jgi:hypothetical protein
LISLAKAIRRVAAILGFGVNIRRHGFDGLKNLFIAVLASSFNWR